MTPNPPASSGAAETFHKHGFWSLIVTQFQVAFNDNALRFLIIFMGLALRKTNREAVTDQVGALFSVPFLLFSMSGGFLADRFSKRTVTITIKICEILVMLLAVAALVLQSLPVGLVCVFLMGTHSAFFGPSKYGLLPELLPEEKLSWGNGILEMGTFMAIIVGSQTGSWMYEAFRGRLTWAGLILVSLSAVGLAISTGITRVPAASPAKRFRANFVADLTNQIRLIRPDRVLWLAVLGNLYFSFLGMLVTQNIVHYGTDTLGVDAIHTGYLFASLAIGIGAGSVVAGYLSRGKIEYGLVPLGAMGLAAFCIALSRPGLSFAQALTQMILLGFSGGFFIVPISAVLQHRPEPGNKGAVLAAANWLSFAGIFAATGVHYGIARYGHMHPPEIFLISGLVTAAGTIYMLWLFPNALLRLVVWMLTNTLYRVRVAGRENIPAKGGALLVSNHISIIHAMLLSTSAGRFIRCMIPQQIYDEQPLLQPVAPILRAIPFPSDPDSLTGPVHTAIEAIRAGELVCAFPEKETGGIREMFPLGLRQILRETDAPIIPVHVDKAGCNLQGIPRHLTVSFGRPMPSTSTPSEVDQAVQDLNTSAYRYHRKWIRTLGRAFVRSARRHPFRFALADVRTAPLRYGSALVRTVFLARRLKKIWRQEEMAGILLPPSIPGALVNYAALLMGKIPVNLNYTASEATIASCAKQCGLRTVVTSKAFLDHVKLRVPGELVLLEDLAAAPRQGEKLLALAMAWTLPARLLEKAVGGACRKSLDDVATVIFSSGSTGEPKGVMLTHYNIGANIEQANQVFALGGRDRILGILPFFHSFGFTVTLALPAVIGIGAVYHANPLDTEAIGPLARKYGATVLLAPPTFLQTYVRRCSAEDFRSLKLVITGAEKLPERVALAFAEKFGIQPIEGYGCTECGPMVSGNQGDLRAGFQPVSSKRGKVGRPLPGISVRVVEPDTMAPVPVGQPGLLLIRGPNVMLGYLGQPEKTREVLRDGWYSTGDVATLDEDGFLEITDRLSRFSKIAGEMIPHAAIENKLHELAGATEPTFAVTSVPDSKKGERLVVLHTLPEEELKEVIGKLSRSDLPNLWKPHPDQFVHVHALPRLGTGKLDLRRLRKIALDVVPAK